MSSLNGNYYDDDDSRMYDGLSDADIERLKENRQERYLNQKTKKSNKTVSKTVMFGSIILVFVVYMTLFILNVTGVINRWVMFGIMAGITAVIVIAYEIYKKKNHISDDDL